MRVLAVRLSDADIRYYQVEKGFRYGIYLELDKPTPANTRNNLCVYRVPDGTTAPLGRIPDELLLVLAEQAALPVAEPQVIARLPYWSYIEENGMPFDVPDGTPLEPFRLLPASGKDGVGRYVQPPNAFAPAAPAAPPAEKPAAKAAPAKEG